MDKKPAKEASAESEEVHTKFALKNRQPGAATDADDDEDDSPKGTMKRRATKYPGSFMANNDDEDDDDDNDVAKAKEEESPKSTMKRRATVYPTTLLASSRDEDDDEDDPPEDATTSTDNAVGTAASNSRSPSEDKAGEKKDDGADDENRATKFAVTKSDEKDEEEDEVAKKSMKRRATRYPGADKADLNDEDDDDGAKEKEKKEQEEKEEDTPKPTYKRRATVYPTSFPTNVGKDDDDDEDEEEEAAKPEAYKRRATIHHIVEEKTISDDEDEEHFKPNAMALKRRNTVHQNADQKEGEEPKAAPPSALKSRLTTPVVVDKADEPQKSAAQDATAASALKIRPPTESSEIKIPSFISKSSESFAYYQYNLKATGEEADKYDFAAARPAMKKSNIIESILHFMKVSLGSGVFTIPEAYKHCGLWTALGLNIVIGVAMAYGIYMLTRSAQRLYGRAQVPMMLYPDIAQACMEIGPWRHLRKYGLWFRYTIDVTIGLGLFSACCIYQIAIGKSLKQLVEGSLVVMDDGNPPLRTIIILLMIPCLLICMITTLKYLAPFTVVADFYIVCITMTTMYYGLTMPHPSVLDFPAFQTVPGLFEFFGICIFSMNGIGATMSVENYMSEPKKFPIVLIIGMAIVMCEVTLIGFFGYWAYGNEVQSVITLNYGYRPFVIVLKIFMALVLYVSYALNFWVSFELVWYYVKMKHPPAHYWFWERMYRAIFVIIITIVAYLLPSVYYFTALIGVLCFSNLTFIFPAFIELVVDWKEPGLGFLRWRLLKFIFFFLIGLVIFLGGTYMNTESLIFRVIYNVTSTETTTSSTTTTTTTTTPPPTTP